MPEEEVQPLTDDERAEALRRFSTRRIHPCEVTGQEVVGGPLVLCPRPGLLVTAPTGKSYFMCAEHLKVFGGPDMTEGAHIDGHAD